jgi:hypothetical protein
MGKPKTVEEPFKGRHFDRKVVILCVHTTIMRWVQRYAPEFEKRWRRFAPMT